MEEGPKGITRQHLFDLTRSDQGFSFNCPDLNEKILQYIKNVLDLDGISLVMHRKFQKDVCRCMSKLARKWEESSRTMERFLKSNYEWLQVVEFSPEYYKQSQPAPQCGQTPQIAGPSRGRPEKPFAECTSKTKKRKTKDLVETEGEEKLSFAAVTSLRIAGKKSAATIIKDATETTPTRASKMLKAYKSSTQSTGPVPYTGEEALSLIVDGKLSKHQYLLIRSHAKEKNANIYPSYHVIRKTKSMCYPAQTAISVTDISAEVSLQSLLDHTAMRILLMQDVVLDRIFTDQQDSLVLISKWGFDGSTGQSRYKQRFSDEYSNSDDAHVFVTSLVPLQLCSSNSSSMSEFENVSTSSTKQIIWQNPRPSSTRFCRPIRFQFIKETEEISRSEFDYVEGQVKNLVPTQVTRSNGNVISVKHQLVMTMVDGKVCNAVTSTSSSQVCYICGASPKDMNNVDVVSKKIPDPTTYSFGLSTLHAWIRFFECLLHIAYRLEIQKWQVRGQAEKELVQNRKNIIVSRFRKEMGLLVDQPKPGGSGTTNDGNSARRFFSKPALSAEITGINQQLIERFAIILRTLASGFDINVTTFANYAKETARLFIREYPWYYMPATVHKILVHGSEVISSAILPIGQLSEEALEARHKDFKKFRECNTRKSSRLKTNEDLLHALLISSDPIISSIRPLPTKNITQLPTEVLHLLAVPKDPQFPNSLPEAVTEPSSSSCSEQEILKTLIPSKDPTCESRLQSQRNHPHLNIQSSDYDSETSESDDD